MRDSTYLALGLLGVFALIITAYLLRKRDSGTLILRDSEGNITAIVPISTNTHLITSRDTKDPKSLNQFNKYIGQLNEFPEEFLRENR